MAESYVRPPLVAREAPSRRAAALAAVIVGVFLLYRLTTGGGEGSPGINRTAPASPSAR